MNFNVLKIIIQFFLYERINTMKSLSYYFTQLKSAGIELSILLWSTIISVVVLCVDIADLPSLILSKLSSQMIVTILLGVVVLLIILSVYKNIIKYYKHFLINSIDFLSVTSLMVCSVCTLKFSISEGYSYKTIIGIILFFVSLLSFVIRMKAVSKYIEESRPNSLFDLKDIYYNDFVVSDGRPIMVSETAVSYDLLGRVYYIDYLYNCLSNHHADTSYVIGLSGEWGSGKTTIINNVKAKLKESNNQIIVDDFDPWTYGSQEALLCELFNMIIGKADVQYSLVRKKRLLKKLVNILSDSSKSLNMINKALDIESIQANESSFLKQEITNYINRTNKTVVIFIDNMDRASPENIVFLFKLIGTIFSLPNIVYVLAYDKDRVMDALEKCNSINPHYIEKIVQHEISIPFVDNNTIADIIHRCTKNILLKYGLTDDEINEYAPVINYVSSSVDSLRTFKRFINSVIIKVFANPTVLDKKTLFAMEAIQFIDIDLYLSIKDNAEFFVSSDTLYDSNLFAIHFDKDAFENEIKRFYESLFKSRIAAKNMLSIFFPYIKGYASGFSILNSYSLFKDDMANQNAPISSAKYFHLYFSYGNNFFLVAVERINDIITKINNGENANDLLNSIYNCDEDAQLELLTLLDVKLSKISDNYIYEIVLSLWNNQNQIANSHGFLMLSAWERSLVIIATLIVRMNKKEIQNFIDTISHQYNKIYPIREIIYWLKSSSIKASSDIIDQMNSLYKGICDDVINNKIDLYSKENYVRNNASAGLFVSLEEHKDKDRIIHEYLQSVYKDCYVYKILADCISEVIGTNGYTYTLSERLLRNSFLSEELILESIKRFPPHNDSEKLVKDAFEIYRNKKPNSFEEPGVVLPIPFVFEL